MYEYLLFDLGVRSEIRMDEAAPLPPGRSADVTITRGEMSLDAPSHPETVFLDAENIWWYCMPSPSRYLFNNITGEYEVADGNAVVVHSKPDADEHFVRAYILGTCLAVVHMQRGSVPIHGASLASGGKALILTGTQGAGKSTLTGLMVQRGFRFLSDDVSVLAPREGATLVLPGYPQRKLCRDACLAQGYNTDGLIWINEDRDKFAIRRREEWHDTPLPAGWLVEVVPADVDSVRVEKAEGKAALALLFQNLYRLWIQQAMKITPHKMKLLLSVAAGTQIYRVYRPKTFEAAETVTDVICSQILHIETGPAGQGS